LRVSFVAIKRSSVNPDGHAGPCVIVKIRDRDSRRSQSHECFDGILCGGRGAFVIDANDHDEDYEKCNDAENGHCSGVICSLNGRPACRTARCFGTDRVTAVSTFNQSFPNRRRYLLYSGHRRYRYRRRYQRRRRSRQCRRLLAVRTFNRPSAKFRWIFDMAFTVLAPRLEVRGFWHGRVAFNHNAPSAVKRARLLRCAA